MLKRSSLGGLPDAESGRCPACNVVRKLKLLANETDLHQLCACKALLTLRVYSKAYRDRLSKSYTRQVQLLSELEAAVGHSRLK